MQTGDRVTQCNISMSQPEHVLSVTEGGAQSFAHCHLFGTWLSSQKETSVLLMKADPMGHNERFSDCTFRVANLIHTVSCSRHLISRRTERERRREAESLSEPALLFGPPLEHSGATPASEGQRWSAVGGV